MPSREEVAAERAMRSWAQDAEKAERMALRELEEHKIHPDSPAGQEFLLRVRAFGITNVQPPIKALNEATA